MYIQIKPANIISKFYFFKQKQLKINLFKIEDSAKILNESMNLKKQHKHNLKNFENQFELSLKQSKF